MTAFQVAVSKGRESVFQISLKTPEAGFVEDVLVVTEASFIPFEIKSGNPDSNPVFLTSSNFHVPEK